MTITELLTSCGRDFTGQVNVEGRWQTVGGSPLLGEALRRTIGRARNLQLSQPLSYRIINDDGIVVEEGEAGW